MAFAISIFFDQETDRAVRNLWNRIDEAGASSLLSKGPYNPHLTLAICADLDVDAFRMGLKALAQTQEPFPVPLASIGTFLGTEGVVFLTATMTQALMALHRQVHGLLSEHADSQVDYYLPDRWNPHCTLAFGLAEEQVAPTVGLCRTLIPDSLTGTITQIGIVDTPAEIEVCRFEFETREAQR